MMVLSKRAVIGRILSSAHSKCDKLANGDPKSCQFVCRTDQGWPKPREGHGHGVPIVVKLDNDQITAKGNRSFDLELKGGTADA